VVSFAGLLTGDTRLAVPVQLGRPLLQVPKARLIATLEQAGIGYAEDPSNCDPRFARSRWRKLMPALGEEGLTPARLAHLAFRVRRGEAAIEAQVNEVAGRFGFGPDNSWITFDAGALLALPDEIGLRLLGRAIGQIGDEGPVELGKLETMNEALRAAIASSPARFRRTLAGAMVSLQRGGIVVERAPARTARLRSRPEAGATRSKPCNQDE
jgi:tRNA(Ile)-lysidine synthase